MTKVTAAAGWAYDVWCKCMMVGFPSRGQMQNQVNPSVYHSNVSLCKHTQGCCHTRVETVREGRSDHFVASSCTVAKDHPPPYLLHFSVCTRASASAFLLSNLPPLACLISQLNTLRSFFIFTTSVFYIAYYFILTDWQYLGFIHVLLSVWFVGLLCNLIFLDSGLVLYPVVVYGERTLELAQ